MTTLDDKLLGYKNQNYVSSSESEGEDENENASGEEGSKGNKIDTSGISAPPDFRLEVPKVMYNRAGFVFDYSLSVGQDLRRVP